MALSTKNRSAGEATLTKAIAERERWEATLAAAEGDAVAANAVIPDTPDDLDRVGALAVATRARTDAARRGLASAREAEAKARRDQLRRIADDTATERSSVERADRDLRRKVEPLLRSLRDLDGVNYGPAPIATYDDGRTVPAADAWAAGAASAESYSVQISRQDQFARQISELMVREAVLRYVAEHGQTPSNGRALLGTQPIRDEDALARVGLSGVFGFEQLPPMDEAQDYLDWLKATIETVASG